VSLKDKPFAFTGTIGSFLRINFVGLFLSIITIGFYIPRYMKRVADFFVNNVEYDGTKANFLGKTGKMFKYYILGLFLPILALIVGGGVYMATKMLQSGATPVGGNSSLFAGFAANIVILVMILPFTYYTYKWMVHIGGRKRGSPGYPFLALDRLYTRADSSLLRHSLYLCPCGQREDMALLRDPHRFVRRKP
jgi:uncharacterized membrane protein YjgN (DUF898 family)